MTTESDYPREMEHLPSITEEIVNLEGQEFYDISEWSVAPFHELPDGEGEASQVHLWIHLAGAEDLPLVMRFKSARSVDPFIGSGTTAMVAQRLGRHCIGIDASATYLKDIAVKRITGVSLPMELDV